MGKKHTTQIPKAVRLATAEAERGSDPVCPFCNKPSPIADYWDQNQFKVGKICSSCLAHMREKRAVNAARRR